MTCVRGLMSVSVSQESHYVDREGGNLMPLPVLLIISESGILEGGNTAFEIEPNVSLLSLTRLLLCEIGMTVSSGQSSWNNWMR